MTESALYRYAPQMRDYDSKAVAGVWWAPYVMFHCGFPNARTPSVNTDGFGVRYAIDRDGSRISPETLSAYDLAGRPLSVVVGASTAFGVGSTSDATTIASLLNRMTDSVWLNLGMRSWVLSQNLVQFLHLRPRFEKLDTIVLFSGVNELDIFMISNLTTLPYGPFYGWREFFSRMNTEFHDAERDDFTFPTELGRMLSSLHHPRGGRDVFLEVFDNCLGNWAMLARQHGANVVFCLQPAYAWLQRVPSPEEEDIMAERYQQYPHNERLFAEEAAAYRDWYRDALQDMCTRHGFGFVDLHPAFDVPELDGRFLFVDPWHLTDEGSERVSRALARVV